MAHPVPKGPLAARLRQLELPPLREGALHRASIVVENAGTVAWRPDLKVTVAYHWLDDRGNPIFWDGLRTPLPEPVDVGGSLRLELDVQGVWPPGRYRIAFDLVAEDRAWFAELGGTTLDHEVAVGPRIGRRLAVQGADPGVLDAQEEPAVPLDEAEAVAHLAPGVEPAPDWTRRVLDAHQEGFGVVGGSIEAPRRQARLLAQWRPGGGRAPRFPHPFVCPSLTKDAVVDWAEPIAGLPAVRPAAISDRFYPEPALYDGRITARLRSGRRSD
jgi:hypothetical protein